MTVFAIRAALCAAALSAPLDSGGAPLVVVCDGPVEMTRGESGRATLVLSGGVRLEKGELSASARRGELEFHGEGGAPEVVSVEGDVVIDSPGFGAKADAARFVRAPDARGFTVTLERRGRRALELRAGAVRRAHDARVLSESKGAGAVRITCGGPVVYSESPAELGAELALSGRLRAETPDFVVRADSGLVTLGPGPEKNVDEASAPPPAAFGVTRIELVGSVEMVRKARPGEGGAASGLGSSRRNLVRRARASRAVFVAAEDLFVLFGEPGPEIESDGVVLTAPEEIRLYVKENRIEAPKGPMRAVIGGRAEGPVTPPKLEGAER